MYKKGKKNYPKLNEHLNDYKKLDRHLNDYKKENIENYGPRKLTFIEWIKDFLKFCSNSKIIMWIAIIELVIYSISFLLGSTSAKWYFLGWLIWLIIILSTRYYFNGSLHYKK